jgi:hypothetical protein
MATIRNLMQYHKRLSFADETTSALLSQLDRIPDSELAQIAKHFPPSWGAEKACNDMHDALKTGLITEKSLTVVYGLFAMTLATVLDMEDAEFLEYAKGCGFARD